MKDDPLYDMEGGMERAKIENDRARKGPIDVNIQ